MKCIYCHLASECTLPDYFFGGCDMDGCDDRGCGQEPPFEDDPNTESDNWDWADNEW